MSHTLGAIGVAVSCRPAGPALAGLCTARPACAPHEADRRGIRRTA